MGARVGAVETLVERGWARRVMVDRGCAETSALCPPYNSPGRSQSAEPVVARSSNSRRCIVEHREADDVLGILEPELRGYPDTHGKAELGRKDLALNLKSSALPWSAVACRSTPIALARRRSAHICVRSARCGQEPRAHAGPLPIALQPRRRSAAWICVSCGSARAAPRSTGLVLDQPVDHELVASSSTSGA